MRKFHLALSGSIALAVLAGCGSSEATNPEELTDSSAEVQNESVSDSLAFNEDGADADSTSSDNWPEKYRQRIRDVQASLPPAEQVQGCAQLNALSDDDLRTIYGSQAGENNTFDTFMTELGIKPTVDDYNLAIEIAIEESREMC